MKYMPMGSRMAKPMEKGLVRFFQKVYQPSSAAPFQPDAGSREMVIVVIAVSFDLWGSGGEFGEDVLQGGGGH